MANKKITQLTASSVSLAAIDLVESSINNGAGVYTSKKLTGKQVFEGVISSTPYLCVYSDQLQAFVANLPTDVIFNETRIANSISISSGTTLIPNEDGNYQLDFTATIKNNGGNANHYVGFYLELNGVSVTASSKFMNAPTGNHHISLGTSWLVDMNATDQLKIVCLMEKADFQLITESAFTGVITPSVQVIMKRIG
jgi:hypothetical protein